MSLKTLAVSTTAVPMTTTPFSAGFNVVVHNPTAGSLTITGSDDDSTYDAGTAVAAGAHVNLTLRKYHKLSSAGTVYLLGSV